MIRTIILLVIGGAFMLMAVRSLRRQRLKERYALLFFFVGLPFVALAAWPRAMGLAGEWLRIDYRTVQILLVGVFAVLMIFKLLSIVSVQDRKIAALTQMVGLLAQKQGLSEKKDG